MGKVIKYKRYNMMNKCIKMHDNRVLFMALRRLLAVGENGCIFGRLSRSLKKLKVFLFFAFGFAFCFVYLRQ